MKLLGTPFVIQNTSGANWLVTWTEAVKTSSGESVSFTVEIPRSAHLTLAEVQTFALKRAEELLHKVVQSRQV